MGSRILTSPVNLLNLVVCEVWDMGADLGSKLNVGLEVSKNTQDPLVVSFFGCHCEACKGTSGKHDVKVIKSDNPVCTPD